MKRRTFIKAGALFLPTIFVPRLIRAQSSRMALTKGASATQKPGANVVGCDSVNDSFLKAYYKLGEASGSRADSKGSNTLTDNGSTGSAAGILGNGASFSGASTLSCADNADLSAENTDFSCSFWFKASAVSGTHVLVGKASEWLVYLNNNSLVFQNDGGSGPSGDFVSSVTISANTLYHVVVVWDSSGSFTKSIIVNDGTPTTVSGTFGIPSSTDAFTIGSISPGGAFLFTGMIDEVLFTKRLLTSSEITSLYNSGTGCRPSPF